MDVEWFENARKGRGRIGVTTSEAADEEEEVEITEVLRESVARASIWLLMPFSAVGVESEALDTVRRGAEAMG